MNLTCLRKYFPLILVLAAISLPFLGTILYKYWSGFVDNANGYNSINAVIAYAGGVVNIITILFLFINYRQQKKQIENDRKDSEFNRALDIVYKQLEYSKRNLYSKPYEGIYKKLMLDLIVEDYDINREILADDNESRCDHSNLFEMLEKEIKPYQIIVTDNSLLTKNQKMLLGNLIGINFAERFDITIERFINLSKKATSEPEFLKNNNAEGQEYRLKNLQIAKDINQIIKGLG